MIMVFGDGMVEECDNILEITLCGAIIPDVCDPAYMGLPASTSLPVSVFFNLLYFLNKISFIFG